MVCDCEVSIDCLYNVCWCEAKAKYKMTIETKIALTVKSMCQC